MPCLFIFAFVFTSLRPVHSSLLTARLFSISLTMFQPALPQRHWISLQLLLVFFVVVGSIVQRIHPYRIYVFAKTLLLAFQLFSPTLISELTHATVNFLLCASRPGYLAGPGIWLAWQQCNVAHRIKPSNSQSEKKSKHFLFLFLSHLRLLYFTAHLFLIQS